MGDGNAHTSQAEGPEARDQAGMRQGGFRQPRAVGFTALAIVLYLLLTDVAVETIISGSPVRWWIAVIVATYGIATAVSWSRGHPISQRLDWKSRATISLFVLLGLVAFSVWLPGGLANGVRLLGQSTTTILIITSVMAVAISGMLLM